MDGYSHDGIRYYKVCSIVITSTVDEVEEPNIEIYKTSTTGEPLYGAVFKVTLTNFTGTDQYGNDISTNTSVELYRVSDVNGITTITTSDIESAGGVYLGGVTGSVTVTVEEVLAPAGYEACTETYQTTLTLSKGSIGAEDNTAIITLQNDESGTPKIEIAKVDSSSGQYVEEAYFDIQVSYTEPSGGNVQYNSDGSIRELTFGSLVDKQENIIRGQTNGGVLDLTVEDFANMTYGFNIVGYTGQITLDIVEVYVSGSYSVSSESKDITLTYANGNLIDYGEYTDSEVVVTYLYDTLLENIYQYATGQIDGSQLNSYVKDYVEEWVSRQQSNYEDLTEEDILSYLKEYVETKGDDIFEACTKVTSGLNILNDVVQIVVEDSLGIEIPDIEIETTKDLFYMQIAGTVFLDQTETKEGTQRDGKLTAGEELLSGIEVTLYESNGTLAELVQKDGEIRTNPTLTDSNGYYLFAGVDPFKEYYVVFKYNGIEYEATVSSEASYNTDEWATSSKGYETYNTRSSYTQIDSDTIAYDYYEIEGIYNEIAAFTLEYMNETGEYPSSMEEIYGKVISNHADDDEIEDKIEYIKSCYALARAGYSSTADSSDTYPHTSVRERFILNASAMNSDEDELEFAMDSVQILLPGQLQVNLGLVERDSTDLQLLTDIVETTVSVNGYDTVYSYDEGNSSYTQYIYEEDYYAEVENTNGIAYYNEKHDSGVEYYYTDDGIEYYMTYEIIIENASSVSTGVVEVVDYYDENFSWANTYLTSRGNQISGCTVTLNGVDISGSVVVSDTSRCGATGSYEGYKSKYIYFTNVYSIVDACCEESELGNKIVIQLTFEMDEASATLYNHLYTDSSTNEASGLMQIGNYAEITSYRTSGGYLDSDSHPGNFNITEYEELRTEFQEAYDNYAENRSSANALILNNLLGKLKDLEEGDAWYVQMALTNSSYHRSLSGSVWEAISDSVQTASDLQDYSGLLEYAADHGIAGIKVELVELCEDTDGDGVLDEKVRACTRTGGNGDYTFTNYIAGNYVVRFTYGETDRSILSDSSTTTAGDALEINGQYYQSTKANDSTDSSAYWYVGTGSSTRYSDAYDDATSRKNQINATISEADDSTSNNYEWDGVYYVQNYTHKDTIYAYTSTLNLEIEIAGNTAIKEYDSYDSTDNLQRVLGNKANRYYTYDVENVDFGLTPRALADINIDKYVSNIKIYLQDGTLQLDAYPIQYNADSKTLTSLYAGKDEDIIRTINEKMGSLDISSYANYTEDTVLWVYLNDEIYENSVLSTYTSNYEPDGLIEVLLDEGILNGATLEVTYAITVSNDGEYDTITYYYNSNDDKIAIAYYQEDITKLPSYESAVVAREGNVEKWTNKNSIVFHDGNSANYYYEQIDYSEFQEVTTAATNIVDYIDPNLNFVQVNYEGEEINRDWQLTTTDEFNTYREKFNGTTTTQGGVEFPDLMSQYNTIISGTANNVLYTNLYSSDTEGVTSYGVGDVYDANAKYTSVQTTLTLSKVLSTSSTGTSDYEYSNLIEIAKVHNDVGRITEIEGYDAIGNLGTDGYPDEETSTTKKISEVMYTNYSPTIGTSKSEKIYRHEATGLSISEEAKTNLGIILIALVILAGGIFLIKKFVLTPKVE